MKIIVDIYHDINTEARTQEIVKCAGMIDHTYFVSFSKGKYEENVEFLLTGNGKRNYYTFLRDSLRYIFKIRPEVLILHDNYTALILFLILKCKFLGNPIIVYDSSELYYGRKPQGINGHLAGIMQKIENKYIKRSDIIIAANKERANIMKDIYGLSELPMVFDNIHRIDDVYDEKKCIEKHAHLFKKGVFSVIYGGGISRARMTYSLAETIGQLGKEYSLIVIGSSTDEETKKFNQFLSQNGYSNVVYIGFVSRADFRFLLSKAHISVSIFAQNTLNNIFCASGKAYESLFEGTPILTTENPPLKALCNQYKVGVSTDDFKEGILEIEKNYEYYCSSVQKYIKTIDYDHRLEYFSAELFRKIKGIRINR